MPLANLPQRNTFVHFQDPGFPRVERSVTCPGSYVPLARACSSTGTASSPDFDAAPMPVYGSSCDNIVPLALWSASPDSNEDASPLRRTESISTAYAWPQPYMMPQIPAASPINSSKASSIAVHYELGEKKAWTKFSQDPESNISTDVSDNELESVARVPADEHTPTHTADHSEDEQSSKLHAAIATRHWKDLSPAPWARCSHASEDKISSAVQKVPVALPVEVKKRWADLSEDEETPASQRATVDISEDQPSSVEQLSLTAALEKDRCADLPEEQSAVPQPAMSEAAIDEISHKMSSEEEKSVVMKPAKPSRPQFVKPTREARTRQFQAKLEEFFKLDFDEVDPSQQDGLTHRMLFGLKSLGELVTFWQKDGTQVCEEGFRLVGLEEADMYALGRVIRKADKLLEERRFREAYDKLCTARRWFDPDTLKDERAKAAAHAEKSLTKKNKKDKRGQKNACESDVDDADDVDGWTQVKSTDKKQISEKGSDKVARKENVHTAQAQITWENNGRKPSQKKEAVVQNPNSKQPLSNNKSQTSMVRRQAGQARRNPQKMLCRYNVGIEQDRSFNVLRKLLGERGSHMKTIAENTGAKLRIRGRGSGYLEGPAQTEASDEPLMLCISAESREGFEAAVQDVESLLGHVHDQYCKFCCDRNLPLPSLSVVQSEQPAR